MIGPIKSEKYANNIIKYIQTKFVKILVQQRKTSQLAYKKVYKFVPLQNFTDEGAIDWSQPIADIDNQLYKKYGLSEEEIEYIEKTIKSVDDAKEKPKLNPSDVEANYVNNLLNNPTGQP